MNKFIAIYGILFLVAVIGICSQGGHATAITWASVAPLLGFGLFHMSTMFANRKS